MSDLSIVYDLDEDEAGYGFDAGAFKKAVKSSAKEDKTLRAVKIIFAILAFCVVLEFAFYKLVRPCLEAPKVSVTGTENYSAAEIVNLLRPMNTKNWFDFNADSAVSILASESGIDSVSVRKAFPNKIYIEVTERAPVAMTFLSQNGRSIAVQIDKSGVLFPEHSFEASEAAGVPIVSGLPIEHLTEGMRIPQKYRTLIDQISVIQNISKKYFAAISEICVIPKEYGNYELAIIPVGSKIKVLTDRTLNEDALKYMMVALDVVNSIEPNVSEIDLRYGSVSYRKR